ncbi:MAG: hypothetical protein P8M80_05915, partial [Pirellulaceae bacterium]|nr:hypothetical protein [Pirellulaceae bacterium]
VKAGKLSKGEAEEKLIAARKKMFGDGQQKNSGQAKQSDRGVDALKKRYMALESELMKAAKAGKLSKGEAEEKLIAARKKMFGGR